MSRAFQLLVVRESLEVDVIYLCGDYGTRQVFTEAPLNGPCTDHPYRHQSMPRTLTLPSMLSPPSPDGPNDNVAEHGLGSTSQVQRFPHTRAQLSAIVRQHRSLLEGYDADDGDDPNRVSTVLVNKVASLLADEQEDLLKDLLKSECGVDDDLVSASSTTRLAYLNQFHYSSNSMFSTSCIDIAMTLQAFPSCSSHQPDARHDLPPGHLLTLYGSTDLIPLLQSQILHFLLGFVDHTLLLHPRLSVVMHHLTSPLVACHL